MKRNIRLTIEYDGSRYQGWQRLGGDSNANTIQGKLESVLSKMTGEDVNINGSGRTDAGVHAYGQVANFHTDCMMSVNEIKNYLTKYLPSDIGIVEVSEASERFHSRLNAKEKTYLYRIAIPGVSNVFERKYLWYFPETLDIKKMEEAASLLIGTHDFKGFSSIKKTKKSTGIAGNTAVSFPASCRDRKRNELRFIRFYSIHFIQSSGRGISHLCRPIF